MIEIIVLIFVLSWFSKTAKRLGKKPKTWAIIAFLSYLIPILIISFIVYPSLIVGWINSDNKITYQLVLLPINLIFGISGIIISKNFLLYSHLNNFQPKKRKIITSITLLVVILISLIYLSIRYKINHSESFIDFKNISGVRKLEEGLYLESIYDFNDYIKKYPSEHTAYYNRGTAYGKLGLYDSAIIDFNKVLSLNKYSNQIEQVRTYKFLGQCYQSINQIDSAIQYFRAAAILMPTDEKINITLLTLYMKIGDSINFCKLSESIDINAIQILPDSISAYLYKCKE